MPNKLYLKVEVFNLDTDDLVEEMTFDYNKDDSRKEYLKLFHQTIKNPALGIQSFRVKAPPRPD